MKDRFTLVNVIDRLDEIGAEMTILRNAICKDRISDWHDPGKGKAERFARDLATLAVRTKIPGLGRDDNGNPDEAGMMTKGKATRGRCFRVLREGKIRWAIKPMECKLFSGSFEICAANPGSADSFTLGIAHREADTAILDAIREVRPPFSPESVVEEFAEVLRTYGLSDVCECPDTQASSHRAAHPATASADCYYRAVRRPNAQRS